MKLNNLPLLRKRMAILGITALAGVTAAQAQFTGIGTTDPRAGLHVAPVGAAASTITATDEILAVEGIKDYDGTDAAYSEVLLYDFATGLFRREAIADLLQGNSEWVLVDETDPTSGIIPRRYATAMTIDATTVTAGVATTINNTFNVGAFATTLGGNLTTQGNTQLDGTLTTTGATVLNSTLLVAGELTLNTVANDDPALGTTKVLIQKVGSDVVTHVTVDQLLASSAFWVNAGTAAAPNYQPRDIQTSLSIEGSNIGIGLATKLTLGLVDQETAPTNASQVLIQDGGEVKYVTVEDLVEQNGIWEYDDTTTPTLVRPRLFPTAMTVNDALTTMNSTTTTVTSNVGITGNTTIAGTVGITGNSTIAGTFDVTGNSSVTGTLTVTPGADGVTIGDMTAVTDVATTGVGTPAGVFERVLITDHAGVVRYIDAADLVSASSEWVFADGNGDGVFDAADKVYVRRLGNDAGGDDVFVDGVGNMVVDATKAYQFGDANNQVNAAGITASAAYTMALGGQFNVNTPTDADVAFTETGAGNAWLYFEATGDATNQGFVGIGTNAPSASLHVQGNIIASHVAQTSDARFKRNIVEFEGALAAIQQLRGVSYTFRGDEFPKENFDKFEHLGFIAQEIREILPQAVTERNDGYLTVDYAAVTPVLVEAVQELSLQIEALQAENASLRTSSPAMGDASTISKLEARLADLDARLAEVAGRK